MFTLEYGMTDPASAEPLIRALGLGELWMGMLWMGILSSICF